MYKQSDSFTIVVDRACSGSRLDRFIASNISECSRSFAADLIKKGCVYLNGSTVKPAARVKPGDKISGLLPDSKSALMPVQFEPEPIEIDIIYEDSDIIIINKKPGLVVHPGPGHYTGTLVNALIYKYPDLKQVGDKVRPGIVHRLDRYTSGIMVIAKNDSAHLNLSSQFKSRTIKKTYLALVYGKMNAEKGIIDLPIGRHPRDRKRMFSFGINGREAVTHWRVKEVFEGASLLELKPKTGRTHQIRVHCASTGRYIVGDSVYCPEKYRKRVSNILKSAQRQMLHALNIEFIHPKTKKRVFFTVKIPSDMENLINNLGLLNS